MSPPRTNGRPLEMPAGRRIPRTTQPRSTRTPPAPRTEGPVGKAGAELAALASAVRACSACGRASDARAFGTGFPRARVFLLKDRPSEADVTGGGSFVDEADALTKAFEALDVPMSWTYGTVAVRCGVTDASDEQLHACAPHLLVELEAVSPRVVVAFGPAALSALRSLDGRCGLAVPDVVEQGEPVSVRRGLDLLLTEGLPEGVRTQQSKRRLWRDLQRVPPLLG